MAPPSDDSAPATKPERRPKKANWRRTLLNLHRDIGVLALGLTIVYGVSGIAVNHRQHWDYNYSVRQEVTAVGQPARLLGLTSDEDPGKLARSKQGEVVLAITDAVGRSEPPRKVFWRSPVRLSLFWSANDADVVDYLPQKGVIEHTERRPRFLFFQFNKLHLNKSRTVWTWFADAYAGALLFLATSGLLMLNGRKLKRGLVLAMIGATIPLLAALLL